MLHPTGFPMSKSSGQLVPTSHSSHSGASRSVSDAPQEQRGSTGSASVSIFRIVHFLPVHWNFLGRLYADAALFAAHLADDYTNRFFANFDDDGFVRLPR